MLELAGAGARAGGGLLGASTSARSMRVPWSLEWLFPGWMTEGGRNHRGPLPGCAGEEGPEHSLWPPPRTPVREAVKSWWRRRVGTPCVTSWEGLGGPRSPLRPLG